MFLGEGGPETAGCPSMALLLFTEDEITFNNGTDDYVGIFKGADGIKLVNALNAASNVSDELEEGIFQSKPAQYLEAMEIDDMEDHLVDAVKVPGDTLQAVCPTFREIRLLAHARQVNPMDKEQCGSDEDGWFSVVICNRLPTKPDTKYHACLVSLEGRHTDGFIQADSTHIEFNDEVSGGITQMSISELTLDSDLLSGVGGLPESGNKGGNSRKKRWWIPKFSRKYLSLMSILIGHASKGWYAESPQYTSSTTTTMSSDPIKLVLLHHWTFKTSVTGGDYESRMKSLHLRIKDPGESKWEKGELVEKVELLEFNTYCRDPDHEGERNLGLKYQGSTCTCGADLGQAHAEPMLLGNDMVRDVARNGYLTTEMTHSDGGVSDVVYRGPLIPLSVDHVPKKEDGPYFNSDQALALAVDIGGLSDISHASAFELGRLLALSDHSFTKAAARWRQSIYVGQQNNNTLKALSDIHAFKTGGDFNFGNLQSCILKNAAFSLSQAQMGINNLNIQQLSQIDPNQPGFGVTDPPPQQFSRIADPQTESRQISETFSLGSAGVTGEIDALKQAYRTMTGQGEPE